MMVTMNLKQVEQIKGLGYRIMQLGEDEYLVCRK
jgi:hypothetical protein